jgi:hypothetical protein
MRPLIFSKYCLISSLLCTTCLASSPGHLQRRDAVEILQVRQNNGGTATVRTVVVPPQRTPASNTQNSNARQQSPNNVQSNRNQNVQSGRNQNSVSASKPLPTPPPKVKSSSSSPAASSTSDSASTPTPAPDSTSKNKVNSGAIAAGVVLGTAVLAGILWIVIAKWRDTKKKRAASNDEEETKGGVEGEVDVADAINDEATDQVDPQRSLSFVATPNLRPDSQIPQDVLPTASPSQDGEFVDMPLDEPPQSAYDSDSELGEMQQPYDATLPPGLQIGRPPSAMPAGYDDSRVPGQGQYRA